MHLFVPSKDVLRRLRVSLGSASKNHMPVSLVQACR